MAVMLSVLMVFSICACDAPQSANYPKNGARKIVAVEKQLYSSLTDVQTLSFAHYENESEVLLVEFKPAIKDYLRGVEPHIYLKNYENFYNRTALTEYINGLK